MIRIGKTYVDPAEVVAIQSDRLNGVTITFKSGASVNTAMPPSWTLQRLAEKIKQSPRLAPLRLADLQALHLADETALRGLRIDLGRRLSAEDAQTLRERYKDLADRKKVTARRIRQTLRASGDQ